MNSYWWSFVLGEHEVVFHANNDRDSAVIHKERMKQSPLALRVGVTTRKISGEKLREKAARQYPGLKVTLML